MRTRAGNSELEARSVNVRVKDKVILDNVQLTAKSGQLLALMGPTGSGKTTLLNVVAGRLPPSSGDINLNGKPFTKKMRRRLAFVQQQDVFFSKLTLWETLYFTAQLRLPEKMSDEEKREKINEIVDTLDMKGCLNTIIGDIFVRGLSGGEKKRASIACELLTDPDILLMDEPTSGLDSSTALSIMQQMRQYADKFNKTIISSIHQPSSQIFYMFDTITLLINGCVGYSGPMQGALGFFENVGLTCDVHYNPADFILQAAKSDKETVDRILSEAAKMRSLESHVLETSLSDEAVHIHVGDMSHNQENEVTVSLLPGTPNGQGHTSEKHPPRWNTSWWKQYRILSWRSFKQTLGCLREGYAIVQTLLVTLVVGLIYWQIDLKAATIRDIMGMMFFIVSYWTFNPAFEAISAYPSEKAVVAKERAAGSYRLSAYYIAKATSELPLTFTLPTFMYSASFIMSGIGGPAEFFSTYPVLLLQVLLSQGFGFALGVGFNGEIKPAFTTFVSYSLCAFMIGGFFSQTMPSWLFWARYLSTMQYPFGAFCHVIFKQFPPIICNGTETAMFDVCRHGATNQSAVQVTVLDILHQSGVVLSIEYYILPVFIFIIGFRVVGYLLLKYQRPKIL